MSNIFWIFSARYKEETLETNSNFDYISDPTARKLNILNQVLFFEYRNISSIHPQSQQKLPSVVTQYFSYNRQKY